MLSMSSILNIDNTFEKQLYEVLERKMGKFQFLKNMECLYAQNKHCTQALYS